MITRLADQIRCWVIIHDRLIRFLGLLIFPLSFINLTDIDSKLMKMKKGIHYEQAYNCQLLVEDKGEIIVGNNISNSPCDVTETIPTMEKFKQEQGVSLKGVEVFQDNGFSSGATAEYYEKEGAVAYIPDRATTKELHGKAYQLSKFDNDNFKLDFKKNQAICPAGHQVPAPRFGSSVFDQDPNPCWQLFRTEHDVRLRANCQKSHATTCFFSFLCGQYRCFYKL